MPTSPATTPRIFISHSHNDNEFGVKLVEDLRRVLGDESAVWYDARGGLHGGDPWWHKIMQELRTRNTFIVVLSPDSVASPWVNSEIDLAWRQKHSPSGKLIIPLLYRQCEIRDDLDTLQFISFLPPRTYEESFNELLIALGLSPYIATSKPIQVANDPDAVFVRQRNIEVSFAAKDWPDVIRKTNLLLKRAPAAVTSEIYRMQGVAFFEEGQVQQAQEAFDAALALVSDRDQRLTILRNYADLLASQDQWSDVLRLANEALRLVPNDKNWTTMQQQAQNKVAEPYLEEGDIHYKSGKYNKAIMAYDHVIRLDPKNTWAYAHRGEVYRMLKDYQRAIQDLDRAIGLNSKSADAYAWRGAAYLELNDYQSAIRDLDQAIKLNPRYAWAYGCRGQAYSALKEYQQAIEDFDHALTWDSTLGWVRANRARAQRLLVEQR